MIFSAKCCSQVRSEWKIYLCFNSLIFVSKFLMSKNKTKMVLQSIAPYDMPHIVIAAYVDAFSASELPDMWKSSSRILRHSLCWHFFSLLKMLRNAWWTVFHITNRKNSYKMMLWESKWKIGWEEGLKHFKTSRIFNPTISSFVLIVCYLWIENKISHRFLVEI